MIVSSPPLASYLRPHRRTLAAGFLLICVHVGIGLSLPFLLRFAVDDLNLGILTPSRLFLYTGLLLLGTVVSVICALYMRRLPIYVAQDIERDIRDVLFSHLTTLDPGFYQRQRTGDLMTRMTSDLTYVREFIGQSMLQFTRTTLVFLVAFPIMFSISARLALALAVLVPTISATMYFMLRAIRPRYEKRQEAFSELSNFTQENFAGIQTIKGYAIEDRRTEEFRTLNQRFIGANLRLTLAEGPIWPVMMFLFSVGTVLVLVLGGRFVIEGEITLGELVQFNQYLLYLIWPIVALGWAGNLTVRGISSWKRIREILDTAPVIADSDRTDASLTSLAGDITFKNVGLSLDGQQVLHDINLTIPEGATVGITGPTGSGKTLLTSLIPRLMEPDTGEIRLGDTDIRAYPIDVLRQGIGIAQQEPFLFSDTLRSNISFGLDEESDETTHWAADVAQLTTDVQLFPHGFDTLLGERGVTLSGGQRQRTAISRAIARNPDIIILDDVLSAIDTQTEADILARLRDVLHERTAVIVSHRVSALRNCDFIVVLESGRIEQLGTHRELVATPGYYRNLEEVQRLEAQLEAEP